MVDVRTVWQLEPAAGRLLWAFMLQPSAGVHRDRLTALGCTDLDTNALKPQGDAGLSRALMNALGLKEELDLDLDEPLHRCALLPPDGLAVVGKHLELRMLAPRLRRVIQRRELQQLQALIDADEWTYAMEPVGDRGNGIPLPAVDDAPLEELTKHFNHLGWIIMDAAFGALPDSVAQRARLKLPVLPRPPWLVEVDSGRAAGMVQAIYGHAVQRWNALWDEAWLGARAA